jgi:hypothetical protein
MNAAFIKTKKGMELCLKFMALNLRKQYKSTSKEAYKYYLILSDDVLED